MPFSAKRSPFPGMDPYLEKDWEDVHLRLCALISAKLQRVLPPSLRARAERRIFLEDFDEDDAYARSFRADVAIVSGRQLESSRSSANKGAVAIFPNPLEVRLLTDEIHERWIKIIDIADGGRVVTVIELLSPGNKTSSKLNERYRAKIADYIAAGVNVVEIDLIRSSRARLAVTSKSIPVIHRNDYLTCINRATDPALWLVYPMPLREPLPKIPIPCRASDDDVALPLQEVIDQVYLEGRYDETDYSQPLGNPLSNADSQWLQTLMDRREATAD